MVLLLAQCSATLSDEKRAESSVCRISVRLMTAIAFRNKPKVLVECVYADIVIHDKTKRRRVKKNAKTLRQSKYSLQTLPLRYIVAIVSVHYVID